MHGYVRDLSCKPSKLFVDLSTSELRVRLVTKTSLSPQVVSILTVTRQCLLCGSF